MPHLKTFVIKTSVIKDVCSAFRRVYINSVTRRITTLFYFPFSQPVFLAVCVFVWWWCGFGLGLGFFLFVCFFNGMFWNVVAWSTQAYAFNN